MEAHTFDAQLADGNWLHISERRTKDGGYVSVGTDITRIKEHEQKLVENDLRLRATVIVLNERRQRLSNKPSNSRTWHRSTRTRKIAPKTPIGRNQNSSPT